MANKNMLSPDYLRSDLLKAICLLFCFATTTVAQGADQWRQLTPLEGGAGGVFTATSDGQSLDGQQHRPDGCQRQRARRQRRLHHNQRRSERLSPVPSTTDKVGW